MSHHDIAPAIRRQWTEEDSNAEIIGCHYSNVSFTRGLGDSGRKIETVAYDCPHEFCRSDRMVRLHHVNPVDRDDVLYWCLYPGCEHFVGEELGWSRPNGRASTPQVWSQTARCPDCDTRHTVEMNRQWAQRVPFEENDNGTEIARVECDEHTPEARLGGPSGHGGTRR